MNGLVRQKSAPDVVFVRVNGLRINRLYAIVSGVVLILLMSTFLIFFTVVRRQTAAADTALASYVVHANHPRLDLSVKTQLIEGVIHYQLQMKAPDAEAVKELTTLMESENATKLRFTLNLEDQKSFMLCKVSITRSQIGRQDDAFGKTTALTVNDVFQKTCSADDYRLSSKWSASSNISRLLDSAQTAQVKVPQQQNPALTISKQPKMPRLTPAKEKVIEDNSGSDVLTGVDPFNGLIETLSGASYKITRQAERMTIALWRATDHVVIACQTQECTLRNQKSGETVHVARKN